MDYIFNYIIYYGKNIIFLGIILFIISKIVGKNIENYHSHWNTLIDNFNFSSEEFYKLLQTELQSQGINNINIEKVSLKEGNALSSKRIYLRVLWKNYQYDICGAPFGKGFFISWWLLTKQSQAELLIAKIPFIGLWLVRKLYPVTYYKIDTASMFMTYANASVQKVIKEITEEKGVRALSESEQKPILNDIFKR